MDIRTYQKELEQKFPKESKRVKNDLALQIANEIERNRISHRLTQNQLAKKIGTRQSGISRLERGEGLPSLTLVRKVANAMKMYVQCRFLHFAEVQSTLKTTAGTDTRFVGGLESASSTTPFSTIKNDWQYNQYKTGELYVQSAATTTR